MRFIESEVRAMRHLRRDLPRARDHARPAARPHAGGARRRACSTKRRSSTASRCGKPLGTQKMIETMLAKLAGHSMFAAPGALDRLRMCADCRVVDLIKNENSVDIRDYELTKPRSRGDCDSPIARRCRRTGWTVERAADRHPRSRRKTRRAPSSTRCWRACTRRRRTRPCWRRSAPRNLARRRRQPAGRRLEQPRPREPRHGRGGGRAGIHRPLRRRRAKRVQPPRVALDLATPRSDRWSACAPTWPALGLARQPGSTLYEDHLAALFETMRILIAGAAERRPASIATQRAFSTRRIAPWAVRLLRCNNAKSRLQITTGE